MRRSAETGDGLRRALRLLDAVIEDEASSNVTALAARCGVPVSTAHRLVSALVKGGYLSLASRGRFVAGPTLLSHAARVSPLHGIVAMARPALSALARKTGTVAHLGVLQDAMVTYLFKTGPQSSQFFTRENMQLEAYSSGIGKVLLAHLPDAALDDYLGDGPFVAFTPRTIIEADAIRAELDTVRRQGFARDEFEISPDLTCLAVPIHWSDGSVHAAISVSMHCDSDSWSMPERWLGLMHAAAAAIGERLPPCAGLPTADAQA